MLKLLQTSAMELRQILVFIWTKILSLDKVCTLVWSLVKFLCTVRIRYLTYILFPKWQSCQLDLVKDGGHAYFIRFLDSLDAYPEQRAMAAFVLAVIVDGHRRGKRPVFMEVRCLPETSTT